MSTDLNSREIIQLIAQYESELKKLHFQANILQNSLVHLQQQLVQAQAQETSAAIEMPTIPVSSATAAGQPNLSQLDMQAQESVPVKTPPPAEAPVTDGPKVDAESPKATAAPEPVVEEAPATKPKPKPKSTAKAKPKGSKKGRGRKKKEPPKSKIGAEATDKGYRLSDWDELVLLKLENEDRLLVRSGPPSPANMRVGSSPVRLKGNTPAV